MMNGWNGLACSSSLIRAFTWAYAIENPKERPVWIAPGCRRVPVSVVIITGSFTSMLDLVGSVTTMPAHEFLSGVGGVAIDRGGAGVGRGAGDQRIDRAAHHLPARFRLRVLQVGLRHPLNWALPIAS